MEQRRFRAAVRDVHMYSDDEIPAYIEEAGPHAERPRVHNYTITLALAPLLTDASLASLLSTLNDYTRLALTCKGLRDEALDLERHASWVKESEEAELEVLIEQMERERSPCRLPDIMCESCGRHPALEWLGYVECQFCYDDHTD